VWDRDAQLLTQDRLADVRKVVAPEDPLGVAIAISNRNDELEYLEYPFLPVRFLIARRTAVSIVYWRTIPTHWTASGQVSTFGEVKFGFWLSGCGDEFCSLSTGALIVRKFVTEMETLASEFPVDGKAQGSREIVVEGAVLATFAKAGRSFDVVLSRTTYLGPA